MRAEKLIRFNNVSFHQLNQEFAFWRVAPPQEKAGIYEMRTYALKPGSLLEWEHEWCVSSLLQLSPIACFLRLTSHLAHPLSLFSRRVGLEARLASGHEPVGAWFSQVGRLSTVSHLWHYESLESRRQTREKSWEIDGWSRTVSKVSRSTLWDGME